MMIDIVLVALYAVQPGCVEMVWLSLPVIALTPMMFGVWLGSCLLHLASEQVFRNLTLDLTAYPALIALFV